MNFVFDIDGTLCFDGKTIDQSIIEALTALQEAGHTIIFASARPIRDLLPVLPATFHAHPLVGGNGCFTSQNGIITTTTFSADVLNALTHIIDTHKLTYLADGKWDYAYTGDVAHPIYKNIDKRSAKNVAISQLQHVCKLVLFQPSQQVLTALASLPVSMTTYKNEQAIDISPLGINKVAGLKLLNIDNFIAFGNDSNDQCLFEHATYSVCVGNNDVQQYASVKIEKEEVAERILQLVNGNVNMRV